MSQRSIIFIIFAILVLLLLSAALIFRKDILRLIDNSQGNTEQKEDDKAMQNLITIDNGMSDPDKGRVQLESELSEYEFVVNSQKKLVDLLYSWGLYNRTYDLREFGKNTGGVDEIMFKLTKGPVEKSFMGMSRYWGESSVEIQAENNRLIVKISFTDKAFPQIKGYISKQALYGLYLISHPPIPNAKDVIVVEEKISRIIDDIEKEGLLFNIAQKPE